MLRIGFVGCGAIARLHMENVKKSNIGEIVAVTDVDAEAAEQAGQFCGATVYADYAQMINHERLDVLFVCVPPFAHGDVEEYALRHELHLFIEKPVALDLKRSSAIADMIDSVGVINGTGYCLRYLDTVERIKTELRARLPLMALGYYLTRFVETPWWRDVNQSGGQIVEQATHIVDLQRYLLGDVATVQSFQSSLGKNGGNIAEIAVSNLRFQSGALGQLSSTCLQPDHRMGLELLGDGFRFSWAPNRVEWVEGEERFDQRTNMDMYEVQDLAFLGAASTLSQSLIRSSYRNALRTLEVTLAMSESARLGTMIDLK